MSKICSKCKKTAITFIRYNGTHLCKDHFIQYFEKRVKKDIKKQGKTENGSNIGVAVSGGKDSTVALYIIYNIFSKRANIDLYAISVDEGIKGYRDKSIEFAAKSCKKLGIRHHIVSFKDFFDVTMDQINSKHDEIGACSYCGVFRRFCLNIRAKELGVKKLVTGHNLDDMAQSILMNFINGDVKKLARLGPHKKVQPGLVPRMFPLRTIPEKENALYAIVKNLEFHDAECPYSNQALRGDFRNIINDLEYKNPGARHSILNSYESIKELLFTKYSFGNLNKCQKCDQPTSQDFCKACILKDRIS
ncbi:MAG: TIGR00269 family protein [Thermoplasmatales archaeon]|nr:MAG: TIGR00269 family protein [Thermoplasmatales archaeon]